MRRERRPITKLNDPTAAAVVVAGNANVAFVQAVGVAARDLRWHLPRTIDVVRTRVLVAFTLAVAGVATQASDAGGESRPACAKSARVGPIATPAPLRITTSCAVYTVFPEGRVRVSAKPVPPSGISWMAVAGAGARVVQRGRQIAVLREGREVWRSSGSFRADGVFATLGRRAIAFSYERYERRRHEQSLYVASVGDRERQVAREERPLGWTRSGQLLSWRFRQGFIGVHLRQRDGTLMRRVGARLREIRFEPSRGTLLALTRSGNLERFNGYRWSRLANLRSLGFGRHASFEQLDGGLIGVLEGGRVGVLRADGSLFALTRFPARERRISVAGQSGLVADASGTRVVFAVTRGNRYGNVGLESLYLLRAGDSQPRLLFSGRLRFAICERWAHLAWRDNWLLYATTEGRTIALDSDSPKRPVDLTPVVRRFASLDAERKVDAQVEWAR
jgi:hypothetical protein